MPTKEQFQSMFGQTIGDLCTPYEAKLNRGKRLPPAKAIVYTHPSPSLGLEGKYQDVGKGFVVIHEEQFSGSWQWFMVHVSRILGSTAEKGK